MKTWDEISLDGRLVKERYSVDPINRGRFAGKGYVKVGRRLADAAKVVFGSNEDGWEHVSVSFPSRCPTWDEMCVVKDVFWREEEACIQVHPALEVYINIHKYCLHIWRPKDGKLILPPDAVPKEAQDDAAAEAPEAAAGPDRETVVPSLAEAGYLVIPPLAEAGDLVVPPLPDVGDLMVTPLPEDGERLVTPLPACGRGKDERRTET